MNTTLKPSSLIRCGWTRAARARDARGREVEPNNPYAVAWDLVGAIEHAIENPRERAEVCWTLACELKLDKSCGIVTALEAWSDKLTRRKSEVIDLLESIGL